MRRVALHTLGCKLNFAESSTIGRQFSQRGYRVVDIDEPAEVCVINTCSVTERADRECRQIVRRALKHSPNAFVVVVGCYAQLQPEEIAAIEGVDLVLGAKEKFNLFDHVNNFEKRSLAQIAVTPIHEVDNFGHASSIGFSDRTRGFLKIQDGCDYSCAFCTIPLARGASRSVSISEIIREAREVVAQGYQEIVLTGVNVGDYGKKEQTNLLALLREMVKIVGLERIRVSSIEPNLLSDELIDFWLDSEKLCKHFHIPLQSGTDEVLRDMRRRYLTDWYTSRVERIKSIYPDAGIGVDVITGFPGETDELFEQTYRFLNELPVSYLHVFTYSKRPNTVAAALPGQVEPRVRFQRNERLRILSVKKRRAFYESFIGKTVEVLFESDKENGHTTGLSSEYVRVAVESEASLTNRMLPVLITSADHEVCFGIVVAEKPTEAEGVYA